MEKDWWFWWKSRRPNKILWAVKAESYETKEDRNYTKNCFKEYHFVSGRQEENSRCFLTPPSTLSFHPRNVLSLCFSCFLQVFNVSLSLLSFPFLFITFLLISTQILSSSFLNQSHILPQSYSTNIFISIIQFNSNKTIFTVFLKKKIQLKDIYLETQL